MFVVSYSDVFLSVRNESGGFNNIPPFSFLIANKARLVFDIQSESAKPSYWSAGWLNFIVNDASLPTFYALERWHRLPLGESIFSVPSTGIYQVRVEPNKWLTDLSIKVWSE